MTGSRQPGHWQDVETDDVESTFKTDTSNNNNNNNNDNINDDDNKSEQQCNE